jgi:small conductance mechanosensitive channel
MDTAALTAKIYELLAVYGIRVVAAAAIFILGRWVAMGVRGLVRRIMTRGKVDPTLVSFVGSLTYIALLAFVIVAAMGQLGIQTASFIAVLGAAGLAVGLALQGSLANFAAGVLLIIFHPFKVNDFIEGGGVAGTVEEIQIFTTQLRTADNKTVIIPNSKLTGDNIVNWTLKGTRRVDMVFGIGYGDDIDRAKAIIAQVMNEDSRILKDPAPLIAVAELADSSVNLAVRPWVNAGDYWNVHFGLTETIKKRFDAEGISIPFPQRDVHLYEHTADA